MAQVPYHIVREVSILKGISHPNVVSLLEVVHKEVDVALVYEFLPRDLRDLLDRKKEWIDADKHVDLPDHLRGSWRTAPAIGQLQMKDYFRQAGASALLLARSAALHPACAALAARRVAPRSGRMLAQV